MIIDLCSIWKLLHLWGIEVLDISHYANEIGFNQAYHLVGWWKLIVHNRSQLLAGLTKEGIATYNMPRLARIASGWPFHARGKPSMRRLIEYRDLINDGYLHHVSRGVLHWT